MEEQTFTIKSNRSLTDNCEVSLIRHLSGDLSIVVKGDNGVSGIWGAVDNADAEMRYALAVKTGSFIRDRATILAEILVEGGG